MSNILEEILDNTRARLTERKAVMPLESLKSLPFSSRSPLPFAKALKSGSGVVAEHKRKSPNRGLFKPSADFQEIIEGFEKAGASALSIFTDLHFFGGSLADLRAARNTSSLPILRNDFIIDQYQIYEAKAYGADAVALTTTALEPALLEHLTDVAMDLKLDVVIEVHSAEELEAAVQAVREFPKEKIVLSFGNIDTTNFHTHTDITDKLVKSAPKGYTLMTAHGITDPQEVIDWRQAGVDGFLIGDYFMNQMDPMLTSSHFIKQV